MFLSTLGTWRVRSSCSEEFYKKSVLKNSTKFTQKHLCWGFFCNTAVGWRPVTSLNTKSGTGAFLSILKIFKNIYFANVCGGLSLKSKIFTGVFFCKISDFYYKRNRPLLYYEVTLSYIPLKIPERVNRVLFQNSQLLLLNIYQETKTCSKLTMSCRNVIQVSL